MRRAFGRFSTFDPYSNIPFRISRSKIDLFTRCPLCFYLDVRLGIKRPGDIPFNLNIAVDTLLKKEFDIHRAKGEAHPLMKEYKIDAIPLAHEKIEEWRNALSAGIQFLHTETNLLVTGGVDDVWVNPQGEYVIVDYKATSKNGKVSMSAPWQEGYKRQLEVYQWLFRQNGFKVSKTGYFVYCNGKTDREAFDGKLEFDIAIIPYRGEDFWIEPTLRKIKKTLVSESLPEAALQCEFCAYRRSVNRFEKLP